MSLSAPLSSPLASLLAEPLTGVVAPPVEETWQSPITTGLVIDVPGEMLDSQRMKDFSPAGTNHMVLTSGRGVVGDGVVGGGLVPAVGGMLDVVSFSVVLWFNPGALQAGDVLAGRYDSGPNKRVFQIAATGASPTTIKILTSADGLVGGLQTWTSTANHLVNGTLIHVVWTYNAGVSVLYVNGVVVAGSGSIAPTLFATDIGFTVLSALLNGNVSGAASGTIRDPQFYSVVLSAVEAAAMYADPEYRPYLMGAGLEFDGRCSSSLAASLTGYPIVDSSGHGRHGVWTGCAGAGSRTGGPQSALWSFSTRAWLNGTSQYVTLAAAFSPGTADFYVEFSLFSGNVATGAEQRLLSCEDSDTDGFRIILSATGVLSAVVNNTAVATGLTLVRRTKYRIRFQRVGDLFNFVVNGTPTATTEIVAANIAVTAAARIGARSHTSAALFAVGIPYSFDLNGALIPGSGNQVLDWQTGCTVTGSPALFLVPAQPGDLLDAFGDTPNRLRLEGALNLDGESAYGQFAIPTPQGAMTIAGWAKPAAASSANMFFLSGEDVSGDGPYLWVASGTTWRANVDAGGDVGPAQTVGAWQHVALVFTGTTVEVYVNGVGSGSPTATTLVGTLANFRAGARAYSLTGSWRGQLAHSLVFSDAKTGPEILALFDFEKSRYGL